MAKYKIADLVVEMQPNHSTLLQRSEAYLVDNSTKSDFSITVCPQAIEEKSKKTPELTVDACEYAWYGYEFYKKLLNYDGMMLHSSCIAVDGFAYLFSAPSGTGKSTHTNLWKKHFGDRAVFINDDKPALRVIDGKICACGTPFSGKTSLNTNINVPVKGICILNRGETNSIKFANPTVSVHRLLNQAYRPQDPELMDKTLDFLNLVLEKIPIYELYCNISDEAVSVAYEFMSKN